ncbi:hypothetical protein H310_07148 [Aphanomyces invadans]|uniref:Uncharacterized protein n=1 Tax=Aphanomyces invadans TaxID=157072 RepID=A0A024U2T8_9STRA|nr:hypothetical protein H310_07148 [Aphanomyces invadans]ETW00564.1 hypothetical protein H310_07148 [Aphanomyces invadans]RHY29370.1 hypothetical protein DYB32_005199 [Aphanomyces invadans]|eukprot:XP_008870699.1 hypothetical protein H310_07148 [Aphanomyces invadans]
MIGRLAAIFLVLLLSFPAQEARANSPAVYRWDPSTQRHESVFSYSNRVHEVWASQDPRQRKWFLAISNAVESKKTHVKVVERKHSYPVLATIISLVVLLTTIFLIIKYSD